VPYPGVADLVTSPPRIAALLAVLALGAASRLQAWPEVFTPQGVHLFDDSDVEYHALRAERVLEHGLGATWRDAAMNFPEGAWIPWPPLFDQAIASGALLAGAGRAGRREVDLAAAFVPPVLGIATLALLAAIGAAAVGGGAGLGAAALLAVLPIHIEFSRLGRADHHVAEALIACWVFLAYLVALRGSRSPRSTRWLALLLLALGLAASAWNMRVGIAICLAILAAHVAVWHVVGDRGQASGSGAGALAIGSAGAGLLLAASIAAWGPPGAFTESRLLPLSASQVALALAGATFGGILWLARRRPSGKGSRAVEVLAAAAISLGLAAILPAFRAEAGRVLAALGRHAWYDQILEFEPLIFSGTAPLPEEIGRACVSYGLGIPAMGLGAWALARWWRQDPQERPTIAFVALWGAIFLALTLFRRRFGVYLAPALALWAWLGLREGARALSRHLGGRPGPSFLAAIGVAAVLAPCLPHYLMRHAPDPLRQDLDATLAWLARAPRSRGRPAVLASWPYGHYVERQAARPVIVNGFGTEVAPEGMREVAEFFVGSDPVPTEELLRRRQVGHVLLHDPVIDIGDAEGYAPEGRPVPLTLDRTLAGRWQMSPTPAFARALAFRLFYEEGSGSAALPGLGGFRLVHESRLLVPQRMGPPRSQFKVFEPVPGILLTVRRARPGAVVVAETSALTLGGRAFTWRTGAAADDAGVAILRLPYATGRNGDVAAGPYRVTDGASRRSLVVAEPQVLAGGSLALDL